MVVPGETGTGSLARTGLAQLELACLEVFPRPAPGRTGTIAILDGTGMGEAHTVHRCALRRYCALPTPGSTVSEARQSLELMLTRINIYANMVMLSMEGLWDWSYG